MLSGFYRGWKQSKANYSTQAIYMDKISIVDQDQFKAFLQGTIRICLINLIVVKEWTEESQDLVQNKLNSGTDVFPFCNHYDIICLWSYQ